jgi:hypothetical protein
MSVFNLLKDRVQKLYFSCAEQVEDNKTIPLKACAYLGIVKDVVLVRIHGDLYFQLSPSLSSHRQGGYGQVFVARLSSSQHA